MCVLRSQVQEPPVLEIQYRQAGKGERSSRLCFTVSHAGKQEKEKRCCQNLIFVAANNLSYVIGFRLFFPRNSVPPGHLKGTVHHVIQVWEVSSQWQATYCASPPPPSPSAPSPPSHHGGHVSRISVIHRLNRMQFFFHIIPLAETKGCDIVLISIYKEIATDQPNQLLGFFFLLTIKRCTC